MKIKNTYRVSKNVFIFRLAKNRISRNKIDNITKSNNKNIDFMMLDKVTSMDMSSRSNLNII